MHSIRMTAAAAVLMLAGSASAQFWSVGPGLTNGISHNGEAVGSGNAGSPYFLWTANAGQSSIGGASAGNGIGGQPSISNDGRYVGGTNFDATNGWYEVARLDRTTGVWSGAGQIPGIGQQVDASVGSGWGISGDGRAVVGLGWTSQGTADTHAIKFVDGSTIEDLGTATVGNSARANAADFDGNVVAGWQDGAGRQGAVWVDGVQELITLANGSPAQEAFAVSDDGNWVTGIGLGPNPFAAAESYRYNPQTDTVETIPNIAVGAQSRLGFNTINADGSLMAGGTWGLGPATFGTAVIWEEGVGTMRFDDYLDGMGIAYPDGYTFAFVSGMSSDGQWFTGWGNGGSGTESWAIRVPAPSTAALLGLGGLAASRRRR